MPKLGFGSRLSGLSGLSDGGGGRVVLVVGGFGGWGFEFLGWFVWERGWVSVFESMFGCWGGAGLGLLVWGLGGLVKVRFVGVSFGGCSSSWHWGCLVVWCCLKAEGWCMKPSSAIRVEIVQSESRKCLVRPLSLSGTHQNRVATMLSLATGQLGCGVSDPIRASSLHFVVGFPLDPPASR